MYILLRAGLHRLRKDKLMNELQIFNNPEFGQIRTVERDGEPWFVGKDVAEALGYTDPNKAISMHVEAEDKLNDKMALSLGQRGGWLINESGLYALVLGSKLPGAKKFKRWVTSEVLPSIRKTGSFGGTDISSLSPQLQAMINIELKMREQEREMQALKEDINRQEKKLEQVADIFAAPTVSKEMWQKETNKYISDLCESYGLNHQKTRGQLYTALETTAGVNIKRRVENKQKRMKAAGAKYREWHDISKLDVIAEDEKLRPIFEGLCRQFAAQLASRGRGEELLPAELGA